MNERLRMILPMCAIIVSTPFVVGCTPTLLFTDLKLPVREWSADTGFVAGGQAYVANDEHLTVRVDPHSLAWHEIDGRPLAFDVDWRVDRDGEAVVLRGPGVRRRFTPMKQSEFFFTRTRLVESSPRCIRFHAKQGMDEPPVEDGPERPLGSHYVRDRVYAMTSQQVLVSIAPGESSWTEVRWHAAATIDLQRADLATIRFASGFFFVVVDSHLVSGEIAYDGSLVAMGAVDFERSIDRLWVDERGSDIAVVRVAGRLWIWNPASREARTGPKSADAMLARYDPARGELLIVSGVQVQRVRVADGATATARVEFDPLCRGINAVWRRIAVFLDLPSFIVVNIPPVSALFVGMGLAKPLRFG